jgi:hypothetical protein
MEKPAIQINARRNNLNATKDSKTMTEEDSALLDKLSEKFSDKQIKKRKGAKNKMFSYVNVHDVRERLDNVLGFRWSWEIVETRNTTFIKPGYYDKRTQTKSPDKEIPGVTVTGRLTVHLPSGLTIYREGNGGASSDKGMGPGDAEKIASSNALKRAAWMFGIGKEFGLDSEEAMDDTTVSQQYFGNSGGMVNPVVQAAPAGGVVMPGGGTVAPGAVTPGVVTPSTTAGNPLVNTPTTVITQN